MTRSGNMASATDWLGNEMTFSHDPDGNLTSQDNVVSTSNPSGTSSTSFAFDPADQNSSATSTLAQTCGGAETLTQSFSGTGGSRNADGQLTQNSNSYSGSCSGQTSNQRSYSYDAAGRVVYQGTSAQGASANNFGYDASGDPTTISSHDSGGAFDTYTQSFDNAGEVLSETPISGSGGASSSYTYDTLGDQTGATTGSSTKQYGFNQVGQMVSTASTNATSAAYEYTGDGLEAAELTPGAVWTAAQDIDATRSINGVSCVGTNFCVAVGAGGYGVIDTNGTWASPATLDLSVGLNAVSCATTSFCVAVGGSGDETTYNGTSWSHAAVDSLRNLNGVSCPTTSFCAAVGGSGYAVMFNSGTWGSPVTADSTRNITAISCTSSSFCVAVGASGYATFWNGSTWTPTSSSIDGSHTLNGVSCTSTTFCVAVDQSGNALVYNGSTWSSSDIDGATVLNAVSCISASFCIAVDQTGHAITYNGSSWSSPTVAELSTALNAISCTTINFCQATDGSGGAVAFITSTAWTAAQDIDATRSINGVSCVGTNFCVAVGAGGYGVIDTNGTWASPATLDLSVGLNAVSCATTSFCVAVGGSGDETTYNGTSWSHAAVDSLRNLNGVSCPTTSFCAAVGGSGYAVMFNSGTWGSPVTADSTRNITAISCTSSSFCVAVGASGYATFWNGSTWTPTSSSIDGSHTLNGVSCTSTTFCVAVDQSGNALVYNGSTWSSSDIDGATVLNAVSCISASFCIAVDQTGHAITYNGSSWSSAVGEQAAALNAVSCVSVDFCQATDGSGDVVAFLAGTPTPNSQMTWDTSNPAMLLSDSTNDYVYGPSGEPIEQVNVTSPPPSDNPVFLTYSPTNSTWVATNTSGDELSFYGFDAFGNSAFGTQASPFGFAGQYQDQGTGSTGFYNMRARWFGPQTGEFTTVDPELADTNQAYAYAADDPVNLTDPSGLFVCTEPGAVFDHPGVTCVPNYQSFSSENEFQVFLEAETTFRPKYVSQPGYPSRIYDLFNAQRPTTAYELKVGYQNYSKSQRNQQQIAFDISAIGSPNLKTTNGEPITVSSVRWWDAPRGGISGVSSNLLNHLSNAYEVTGERYFSVIWYVPESDEGGSGLQFILSGLDCPMGNGSPDEVV